MIYTTKHEWQDPLVEGNTPTDPLDLTARVCLVQRMGDVASRYGYYFVYGSRIRSEIEQICKEDKVLWRAGQPFSRIPGELREAWIGEFPFVAPFVGFDGKEFLAAKSASAVVARFRKRGSAPIMVTNLMDHTFFVPNGAPKNKLVPAEVEQPVEGY